MPVLLDAQYHTETFPTQDAFEVGIQNLYSLGWTLAAFDFKTDGTLYAVFSKQQLVAL